MMLTCSKTYRDIPFAHRQHNHDGHCAWIHGHNWGIKLTFGAEQLDLNGFVIDFGKLKFIKKWIDDNLDHALLLNETDPYREYLTRVLAGVEDIIGATSPPRMFASILPVPDGSAEGLAKFFYDTFNPMVQNVSEGRVHILEVTVLEDTKNEASYSAPYNVF